MISKRASRRKRAKRAPPQPKFLVGQWVFAIRTMGGGGRAIGQIRGFAGWNDVPAEHKMGRKKGIAYFVEYSYTLLYYLMSEDRFEVRKLEKPRTGVYAEDAIIPLTQKDMDWLALEVAVA